MAAMAPNTYANNMLKARKKKANNRWTNVYRAAKQVEKTGRFRPANNNSKMKSAALKFIAESHYRNQKRPLDAILRARAALATGNAPPSNIRLNVQRGVPQGGNTIRVRMPNGNAFRVSYFGPNMMHGFRILSNGETMPMKMYKNLRRRVA
jgi:hypothetical protein